MDRTEPLTPQLVEILALLSNRELIGLTAEDAAGWAGITHHALRKRLRQEGTGFALLLRRERRRRARDAFYAAPERGGYGVAEAVGLTVHSVYRCWPEWFGRTFEDHKRWLQGGGNG